MKQIEPVAVRDGTVKAIEDPQQVAAYVEEMSRELITLATRMNLGVLAYLLDLVREEAAQCRQPREASQVRMATS